MNHLLLKQDLGTGHPSRSTYFFKHKMDQIELLHIHRLGRIPLSRSAFRIAWLSQRSGKDAKERSCLQIPDSRAFIDSDNILKKTCFTRFPSTMWCYIGPQMATCVNSTT